MVLLLKKALFDKNCLSILKQFKEIYTANIFLIRSHRQYDDSISDLIYLNAEISSNR